MIGGIVIGLLFAIICIFFLGMVKWVGEIETELKGMIKELEQKERMNEGQRH